jgi:hypothetical protein
VSKIERNEVLEAIKLGRIVVVIEYHQPRVWPLGESLCDEGGPIIGLEKIIVDSLIASDIDS